MPSAHWILYGDFIALLRDCFHRWPWWISPNGEIRTEIMDGEELDPITATCALVHHVLVNVESYRIASRHLGLDDDTADAIAQASDLAGAYNAHVRADLIDALHLSEQWGRRGRWDDPAYELQPYPHQFDRPFRPGSGSAGFARGATWWAPSRFIPRAARPASRWKPRVSIAPPAAVVSIGFGWHDPPAAGSSSFSVGPSRTGCALILERLAAD